MKQIRQSKNVRRQWRGAGLLLSVALALAGCRVLKAPAALVSGSKKDDQLTELQMRSKLFEFVDNLSVIVQNASGAIVSRSASPAVRRSAVEWKTRTVPLCRRIVLEKQPREAFVDLWAFCVQLHCFFVDGAGVEELKQHQDILEAACKEMLAGIESVGHSVLDEEDYLQAKADVEAFALEHPISGSLARQAQLPSSVVDRKQGGFNWLGKIPVVGAFEGLDESARAVREFTGVADRFTRVASALPEESRWQMELFLYDVERLDTVTATREIMEVVSTSTAKLADTAADLPEDVRGILDDSFGQLEQQREGWQETIAEVRLAIGDLEPALERGQATAGSLERTGDSLARAGVALEGMALAFMGPPNERDEERASEKTPSEKTPSDKTPSDTSDGGGFDVTEYGTSADSIGAAATEIRTMLSEVRDLVRSDDSEAVLQSASDRAGDLVDHIAWRTVQVVAVSLLALLIYRLAASRLLERKR